MYYTRKMLIFKGFYGFSRMLLEVNLAEEVGFEPTWELSPPIRFRVGAVMAASVLLQVWGLSIYFVGGYFPGLFKPGGVKSIFFKFSGYSVSETG